MGLFDMFKTKTNDYNPVFCTVCSMLYLISSDGDLKPEELGQLLSVIGGKRDKDGSIIIGGQSKDFINQCFEHNKKVTVDEFLNKTKGILTTAQKLYIVTNMLDSSLSDGDGNNKEQALIDQFIKAFEIDLSTLSPIYLVLELKNDRNIFKDSSYIKNQDDYEFKIKV